MQQLESAIAALRGIVSNVASNDALARLADDVHTLSSKVDQLSRFDGNSDAFAMLEQRLAALTSTLESQASRRPPATIRNMLENALRALSERIDRMPVGNDNASAFAHLEQRVSYLLERLEASSDRSAAPAVDLGRVEEGLHDILRSLERQHASLVALADSNSRSSADTAASRWTPASSIWSSASCPTSASASRKPTATPRIRSKPFTARSATWSIAWR